MPNISGVNFSVVLTKAGVSPFLHFTDTTPYVPGGINPATVTGAVTITQPDGITRPGNLTTPDVFWQSGALVQPNLELRLTTDNKFQQGGYTITYTARAAGYTDTTVTKVFTVTYTPALVTFQPNFDLFTPALNVTDTTDYVGANYLWGIQAVNRTWAGVIHSVGGVDKNISGNQQTFDLIYGGQYYDAQYTIKLTVYPQFVSLLASWVTLIDALQLQAVYTSQTPPAISVLDADMATLKNKMDAASANTDAGLAVQEDFTLASSLYNEFRRRGCDGLMAGLDTTLYQLLKIFNNNVNPQYVNTNAPIPVYDFKCPGSTGSTAWANITGKPATINIEWVVGAGGFPGNGATTMTDARFIGIATAQIVFFRNGQPQMAANPGDGNAYYTKASTASNTIVFSTALNTGEEIKLVLIPL
jgi:hypothetical protein